MVGNSWLWIALIAFLVFCCLPMLFMGRHDKRPIDTHRKDDESQSSARRDNTPEAK